MSDNIKLAIERLRAQVSIKFDHQHDDQQDYDILAVCDYAEKASKVVEAAAHLRLPCSDWTTSGSRLRRCGVCWFCLTHKALASMEEQ